MVPDGAGGAGADCWGGERKLHSALLESGERREMTAAAIPSTRRTVAVTGATGFVGRHLVAELTRRGRAVRALAHSPGSAGALPVAGVSVVEGDLFAPGVLQRLVTGVDAVVHLVGIRREGEGRTFERMHVEATARVVAAMRQNGVSRLLHMSALGADPDGASAYQRTKFSAEKLVRASGLDWTIFRPSIIHGPDGEFVQMVKGWATGRKAPWFFLPYFQRLDAGLDRPPFPPPSPEIPKAQPVYVGDVARAFADALDRAGTVHEVIALGGPDELAWPEMLTTLRDAMPLAKKAIRPIGLPAPIAIAKARVAGLLGLAGALPYSVSDAQMGSIDNVCANDKARATLGFDPLPLGEAVRSYASSI